MFGLINKITAKPDSRDRLIQLMLQGSGDMPGCLSYIVAADAKDPDTIWVTEVWDSPESHKASLEFPEVKQAIGSAMPLIAGFESVATTTPRGGTGL
ncbi:antibiotic biosynthesis monooxygenase [Agaricicola taiwanensis]|uniref:Antibiotic biosynthesis monooxygenase n=1 Tax=Agaricicola taiwanensis TaxID=591372 RepID=A0A8J2YLZ3_9RHOB|nr:putative quinol monooxygenase [Agaricicola taiwanensis]GGE53536.1 antibiotic biosynthesis monooxygenase [Agaricicola taiwanensis]